MTAPPRDHGGALDEAIARYGGRRQDWLDLSTGINPVAFPLPDLPPACWTELPDAGAMRRLTAAARAFWGVPEHLAVLPAPGTSALIARLPALQAPGRVAIPGPTYNEHAAAFAAAGWQVLQDADAADAAVAPDMPDMPQGPADALVLVHPNNPDGRWHDPAALTSDDTPPLVVIDESFCDLAPERSFLRHRLPPGGIVLKGVGKFWGLAGLRLGFAIGRPEPLAALAGMLGPWPVSGPALAIGTRALRDPGWAERTRTRLKRDAARLRALLTAHGAHPAGGTDLFGLFAVDDAAGWQDRLARRRIWTRRFPYSRHWLRVGLPPPGRWPQLERAL